MGQLGMHSSTKPCNNKSHCKEDLCNDLNSKYLMMVWGQGTKWQIAVRHWPDTNAFGSLRIEEYFA